MPTVRLYFDGQRVGEKFSRSLYRQASRVRNAARAAAFDAAEEIKAQAATDIASAGNYGPRWQFGLDVSITEGGGNLRVAFSHKVPYFSVPLFGKVIYGKPLLWIPLSFAADAQGIWARNYPGGLFRVDRIGKSPLLLSYETREPKYFGRDHVTIPKKFHTIEIIRAVAKELPAIYADNFRRSR